MISEKFVFVGFTLSLIGASSYVLHTLQGKTRPNRVTWLMWALAPLVAFAAEIHEGVGIQALLTFMVGFGPLMVLTASFINRKAVWKVTRFDIWCGILSFLGLILWLVTRHGNIAIALAIAADGLAAIPTVRKSWTNPESESYLIYLLASMNATIVLLTIDNWNFATYGFPIYIAAFSFSVFCLIKFKLGLKFRNTLVI